MLDVVGIELSDYQHLMETQHTDRNPDETYLMREDRKLRQNGDGSPIDL